MKVNVFERKIAVVRTQYQRWSLTAISAPVKRFTKQFQEILPPLGSDAAQLQEISSARRVLTADDAGCMTLT